LRGRFEEAVAVRNATRAALATILALVLIAVFSTSALAIPPFLHADVSAPGDTGSNGWVNVPLTVTLRNITWDDPVNAGTYDITSAYWQLDGGDPVSIDPTSAPFTIDRDGHWYVGAKGTWGGGCQGLAFDVDMTPPSTSCDARSSCSAGPAQIAIAITDQTSGPRGVKYALDQQPDSFATCDASSGVATIAVGAGKHDLWYAGVDVANNAEKPWHHVSFTVGQRPLVVGAPTVRVHGKRARMSGSLSGLTGSAKLDLVLERFSRHTWRRAGSRTVRVSGNATKWSCTKILSRHGKYRVRVLVAAGGKSRWTYFRR
jgi:hypothetical protein